MTGVRAQDAEEPVTQLVVTLADGSRLLGSTTRTGLSVRSETLGRLEVGFERIRSIKFAGEGEAATLRLRNGDVLQGRITSEKLRVRTLAGEISVPLAKVASIEVRVIRGAGDLRAGLVAYFPLNPDAEDRSGNGNHGRVTGAVFEPEGLRFKGDTSSYVLVRRAESLEPSEAITISMWVKGVPGQRAGSGWGTVLRKADHCEPGYFVRGGGVSQFELDGENPCGRAHNIGVEFQPFSETRWQHIAGTYSRADGVVKTFQDGELVGQKTWTEPLLHSGDLYIGGAGVAGDDGGFRGLIREVRIYNRALSPSEVRALATDVSSDAGQNAR
jgi:hypothetical protein